MDQQSPNEPAQTEFIPSVLKTPENDVEENKDMAALSYAWILSLVVFFTRRNSPFVRFHAKQGIVLFILSIIFWAIPFVGTFLELVVLAFCAFGFIAAAQGQWKELPFIGAMAKGDWKTVRETWKSLVNSVADGWRHVRKEPTAPKTAPPPPSPEEHPSQDPPSSPPAAL